jgi:hypothetical protein
MYMRFRNLKKFFCSLVFLEYLLYCVRSCLLCCDYIPVSSCAVSLFSLLLFTWYWNVSVVLIFLGALFGAATRGVRWYYLVCLFIDLFWYSYMILNIGFWVSNSISFICVFSCVRNKCEIFLDNLCVDLPGSSMFPYEWPVFIMCCAYVEVSLLYFIARKCSLYFVRMDSPFVLCIGGDSPCILTCSCRCCYIYCFFVGFVVFL